MRARAPLPTYATSVMFAQTQTSSEVGVMSALPSIDTKWRTSQQVRDGPKSEVID